MTREKVKVLSHGPTADNMLVNGKVVNNTEWVPILAIKVIVSRVFGKTVKRSNGWIMRMNNEKHLIHSF
jgi:hypothetical protein